MFNFKGGFAAHDVGAACLFVLYCSSVQCFLTDYGTEMMTSYEAISIRVTLILIGAHPTC